MKRMGSIMILLVVMATPARAQRQGGTGGPGGPDGVGHGERTGLQADAIIRLRERLSLSEEQVRRVREAQESERAAQDAMRLETRVLRDQLRDDEITREEFREEMARRRTTAAEGRVANRERLEGILTDEQRSQMQDSRRQTMRGRGARGARSGRGEFRARRRVGPARGARAQRARRHVRPRGGVQGFGRR